MQGLERNHRHRSRIGPKLRPDPLDVLLLPPKKLEAPCCLSHRDELSRFPIGWCLPKCIRRPGHEEEW